MPKSIIEKVNKMESNDGNHSVNFLTAIDKNITSLEKRKKKETTNSNEHKKTPAEFPGINLKITEVVEDDDKMQECVVDQIAIESENNADIIVWNHDILLTTHKLS